MYCHPSITVLNFTRSWGFGIFRVYWVSKSKCIISSNLRAEGSWGKVLNVVIFAESVVHRSNWRSRETETVGNSRERPGVIMPKLSIRLFFGKKNFPRNPIFFESATGNSWKQLGLVPLTRQKKIYLKPFKVHFLYKLVLNSSFFAESKVRAPTVSNCFPLRFQKRNRIARIFFLQKSRGLTILAWSRRAAPDCFRLFPTVSDCFSFSGTPVGPVDHWFNKNHNIQHFSSRPFCAQVARNDAFWLWNPIYPKNPKTPRPREIQ